MCELNHVVILMLCVCVQECSALAYMLDHLVCNSSASDKDTAGHVRVLIAALASCNHAPDAQTILVTEVGLFTLINCVFGRQYICI